MEPMKNKYREYATDLWCDKIRKERLGQESANIFSDVKSAVEWLNENIRGG